MMEDIRNPIEEVQLHPEFDRTEEPNEPQTQTKKKLYTCELCNVQVTSSTVLRRHMEGRKHIMRVERQGKTFECELCSIAANSQSQLDAHLRSSKHKTRLLKKEKAHQIMNKIVWVIIFAVICMFIAFLALFKYI